MADVIPFDKVQRQGTSRSDDELVMLAQAGRRDAFESLIRRHQTMTLQLCVKYLGDPTLAQDAAQRAFIELHRYLPRYEARGKFKSLLCRIAVNQCKMLRRSQKSYDRMVGNFQLQPTYDAALPDDVVLSKQRRQILERGIQQLGDKLRPVMALRFGTGMAYEEIAQTLDIPLGTVKSRLAAGIKKLEEVLQGAQL